jgi:hypothetical protein
MIYSVLRQRHLKEAIHLEDQLARELEAARRRARADIESRRNEERDRLLAVFEQVTKRSVSCTVHTVIIMPQPSVHPSRIRFLLVNLSSLITNLSNLYTRSGTIQGRPSLISTMTTYSVLQLCLYLLHVGIHVLWPHYSILFS